MENPLPFLLFFLGGGEVTRACPERRSSGPLTWEIVSEYFLPAGSSDSLRKSPTKAEKALGTPIGLRVSAVCQMSIGQWAPVSGGLRVLHSASFRPISRRKGLRPSLSKSLEQRNPVGVSSWGAPKTAFQTVRSSQGIFQRSWECKETFQ